MKILAGFIREILNREDFVQEVLDVYNSFSPRYVKSMSPSEKKEVIGVELVHTLLDIFSRDQEVASWLYKEMPSIIINFSVRNERERQSVISEIFENNIDGAGVVYEAKKKEISDKLNDLKKYNLK